MPKRHCARSYWYCKCEAGPFHQQAAKGEKTGAEQPIADIPFHSIWFRMFGIPHMNECGAWSGCVWWLVIVGGDDNDKIRWSARISEILSSEEAKKKLIKR